MMPFPACLFTSSTVDLVQMTPRRVQWCDRSVSQRNPLLRDSQKGAGREAGCCARHDQVLYARRDDQNARGHKMFYKQKMEIPQRSPLSQRRCL